MADAQHASQASALAASEAPSLLPCPFCGSVEVERSEGKTANGSPWHYIECSDCGACAEPPFWNRRAAPIEAEAVEVEGREWQDLLKDALESVEDYRAGKEFGSRERKLIGRLKSALATHAPSSAPDVAKMVEEAKRLVRDCANASFTYGEYMHFDDSPRLYEATQTANNTLRAAIEALGADAIGVAR